MDCLKSCISYFLTDPFNSLKVTVSPEHILYWPETVSKFSLFSAKSSRSHLMASQIQSYSYVVNASYFSITDCASDTRTLLSIIAISKCIHHWHSPTKPLTLKYACMVSIRIHINAFLVPLFVLPTFLFNRIFKFISRWGQGTNLKNRFKYTMDGIKSWISYCLTSPFNSLSVTVSPKVCTVSGQNRSKWICRASSSNIGQIYSLYCWLLTLTTFAGPCGESFSCSKISQGHYDLDLWPCIKLSIIL